jgi:hypothetical protein
MSEPFFHVFRLPEKFPSEYCFGSGVPVNFQMVDWFGGPEGMSRDDINAFIGKKQYAIGKLLVIERNSGECWQLAAALSPEGAL